MLLKEDAGRTQNVGSVDAQLIEKQGIVGGELVDAMSADPGISLKVSRTGESVFGKHRTLDPASQAGSYVENLRAPLEAGNVERRSFLILWMGWSSFAGDSRRPTSRHYC